MELMELEDTMGSMQIPHHDPVAVTRETTVADAAARMNSEGVGSLLVTEDDRVVGIVTDRDLALRAIGRRVPYDGRVDAVMTSGVVTVPRDATRDEVIATFWEHAIRRLPVVDGGKVVGMVALDDLLASVPEASDVRKLAAVVRLEVDHPRHEAGVPSLVVDAPSPAPRPGRWQARVGDHLLVHARTGHDRPRDGEILGVHSPAGDPPFQVRWSDEGHTTYIYPGPDAEIRHLTSQPA